MLLIANMQGDFVIESDAYNVAIGGVLSQDQGNRLQPITYYSKKLTGAPCNYATHERELLAIVIAIKSGELTLMASIHGLLLIMLHLLHCIPSLTSHPTNPLVAVLRCFLP